MGQLPRRRSDGRWECTLAEAAREEVGFEMTETYIRRRQNLVAQYIVTRTILEMCEAAERKRGARVEMRWWEQAGVDLAGAREMAAEADEDGLEE